MGKAEHLVANEAKAMTRAEVLKKAQDGVITWQQAADICGITSRHLRRLKERHEVHGVAGLRDGRAGRRTKRGVSAETIDEVCRLKREVYPDFSIRHFHQFATEKHGIRLGYTKVRDVLHMRGVVEPEASRGKYRRRRERRPMRGMLVHLDASTHEWIPGLPMRDLVIALDDADGRALYGRFVEQEGTMSTLEALDHVLRRWGRFCELYTDRGSHFCTTTKAGPPDEEQHTQLSRVLKALGIRHILARSPEARGRSERYFGTVQGRLPQELRLAGIRDYEAADRYLNEGFLPDLNRRFTVEPREQESAFVPLAGMNLELLLSVQHERIVQRDNTVVFERMHLQLSPTRTRHHFVRCPVLVHELLDGTLAVSHQGTIVARFSSDGIPLTTAATKKAA
jgi:hypothetical protein